MNRQRHLELMAQSLYAAVDASDWQAMAAADRDVSALLAALAAQGKPTVDAWPALEPLRRAHRLAQEHCALELEKTGKRLADMRDHKDGWIAYALNDHAEEEVRV